MAVFIHVSERDPLRARLTANVDRHVAGVDMLTDAATPRARSAVHLVFLDEKVRTEYAEPVPASPPVKTREGILLATVADLVRMKLTSYRLKDRVHIQDLDAVGLITQETEHSLSELFKKRLAEIRASE